MAYSVLGVITAAHHTIACSGAQKVKQVTYSQGLWKHSTLALSRMASPLAL